MKLLRMTAILLVALFFIGLASYGIYYFKPVHYSNKVVVLEYHDVSDSIGDYSISPVLFRKQLETLKRNRMHFITVDQLRSFANGGTVPDNAVFVTFDDGYKSFETNALPILQELNVPSIQFLITSTLQEPGSDSRFLNHNDAKTILDHLKPKDPEVNFGCHTHNSHMMVNGKGVLAAPQLSNGTLETAAEYHQRVASDWNECQAAIKQIYESAGKDVSKASGMWAYPFGSFDRNALPFYQAIGVKMAFSGEPRLYRPGDNPLLIPRIDAGVPSATPKRLLYWIKRGISRHPN